MRVLTDIGLVPNTPCLLLVGATSGEVLVAEIPTKPRSRAISVYHYVDRKGEIQQLLAVSYFGESRPTKLSSVPQVSLFKKNYSN